MTSKFWIGVSLAAIIISIPLHALVLAYFFNKRLYIQKKRALLDWMTERGWVDEDWGRKKRF